MKQCLPPEKAAAAVGRIATTVLAAVLAGSAYSQPANPPTPGSTSNSPPSEASVNLLPSQLGAIKIQPLGTHIFPVDREAVGSVSFESDPSTVQAESTLIGAAATFNLTSKELARAKELYATNVGVSERELEQAINDQQTAEAALKAARDAVRALGQTDADIDAMIAEGRIDSALATHHPPTWVLANVAESDRPLLREGQPVKVKVGAFPGRVFDATISKIYATIDPNTHRVAVRCEAVDPNGELQVGMLANVVIEVQAPILAPAIPVNGVVREGDGTLTAWVTTDRHRFVQRIVKTGLRSDGWVQILEGLQIGELVVTDGAIFLDNILQAPPTD